MSLQDLVDLVRSGDLQHVEDFLSTHQIDLNRKTRMGVSPLMVACKNGHLEIVKLLLQKGADVDFEHQSALMAAVEGGNVEVVNLLLEHGANPEATGNETVLSLACEQGSIEVVEVLLPKIQLDREIGSGGTSVNLRGWKFEYTHSPLSIAVEHNNVELVKWFLEGHANFPMILFGVLLLAITKRNHSMVEVLLQNGANVNETGEDGMSALMLASDLGESAIVQILLDYGAEVNLKTIRGSTALLVALCKGRNVRPAAPGVLKIVELLLDAGADVNLVNKMGFTPLIFAAEWYPEAIKLLLEKKAMIDYKNAKGDCALKRAVHVGNMESARILLEAGAKSDIKDNLGHSLLMTSMNHSKHPIEMIKLLLDHGFPIGLLDNEGCDALLSAVGKHKYEVVEVLLERGADPTLRPDQGCNAKTFLQNNIESILVG